LPFHNCLVAGPDTIHTIRGALPTKDIIMVSVCDGDGTNLISFRRVKILFNERNIPAPVLSVNEVTNLV
jgi:hypothetical protein